MDFFPYTVSSMQKYWFHQRKNGYGFVPTSWQGWACTIITLALIVTVGMVNELFTPAMTGDHVFRFLVDFVIIVTLFAIFIRKRIEGGFSGKRVVQKDK